MNKIRVDDPTTVFLSVKRKDCELILKGIKTVEIRKSIPGHMLPPFKVLLFSAEGNKRDSSLPQRSVVGECVCDRIERLFDDTMGDVRYHLPKSGECCMDEKQLTTYGSGKAVWGWHLSSIRQYKTPLDPEDLGITSLPRSWCYAW